MKKVTLASSNPYLRDPAQRAKMIQIFASSSTAIEGVNVSKFNKSKKNKDTTSDKS